VRRKKRKKVGWNVMREQDGGEVAEDGEELKIEEEMGRG
jgi:hypothetical protein